MLSKLALVAAASAHTYTSGKDLRVWQQRKSYCTLLSFNGDKRNPSPSQCERAARKKALLVCEAFNKLGFTTSDDDLRCLSILETREAISRQDCALKGEKSLPLFVRVDCQRFGYKKPVFNVYDLIASIPLLEIGSAPYARYNAFKNDETFSFFDTNYWVFERETRCHGLIGTFIVPESDPMCVEYYNDEDSAVCNYLKTIFDDLWDLGCWRTRQTILDVANWHCNYRFVGQLNGGEGGKDEAFCLEHPDGEDVNCDALNLICGSAEKWIPADVALPPYFLNDGVIENLMAWRNDPSGEELEAEYESGKSAATIPLLASLDYLEHTVRKWRGDYGGLEELAKYVTGASYGDAQSGHSDLVQ